MVQNCELLKDDQELVAVLKAHAALEEKVGGVVEIAASLVGRLLFGVDFSCTYHLQVKLLRQLQCLYLCFVMALMLKHDLLPKYILTICHFMLMQLQQLKKFLTHTAKLFAKLKVKLPSDLGDVAAVTSNSVEATVAKLTSISGGFKRGKAVTKRVAASLDDEEDDLDDEEADEDDADDEDEEQVVP